jgi:hypothetical protein
VRFSRKHPAFGVKARLGMTPLSLGLHTVLAKTPALLDRLDRVAQHKPGLPREIVYQYHYVSGIKEALAHA